MMDAREAAAPPTANPKEKENSLCLDHVRIRQVLHVLPILERALQLDCRVGATPVCSEVSVKPEVTRQPLLLRCALLPR